MASGLERGSRSANKLNQADISLDDPGPPVLAALWADRADWPEGGCIGGA